MRDQLKFICTLDEFYNPTPCASNPSFCAYGYTVCDGVANCPNGDDEEFEICQGRGVFSDLATFTCEKKDVYNVTIMINAVLCDGNYECKDGEDEKNCSLPNYVLIVSLGIVIIGFGIFGYVLWKANSFILTKKHQMSTLPDFEMLHGTEALKETMFHELINRELSYEN